MKIIIYNLCLNNISYQYIPKVLNKNEGIKKICIYTQINTCVMDIFHNMNFTEKLCLKTLLKLDLLHTYRGKLQ